MSVGGRKTVRELVREVAEHLKENFSTKDVCDYLRDRHPELRVKEVTIRCHLMGCSVNHPSAKHYPSLHRNPFLFYMGSGRYKLYAPSTDLLKEEAEEEMEVEEYVSLSLEEDLERFVAKDLGVLEEGLQLYSDKGVGGRQFNTDVGRIDILALDKSGNFVVIELKGGIADDRVCGQILGYIRWIRQNLSKGKEVRGMIVANEFSERLQYAMSELPNVKLKKYDVEFKIQDVMP